MEDAQIQVITKIITAQQAVMGNFATDLAQRVPGLRFDGMKVSGVDGNFRDVLERLVQQYSSIFGQSSVEVCKDALSTIEPSLDRSAIPENLLRR